MSFSTQQSANWIILTRIYPRLSRQSLSYCDKISDQWVNIFKHLCFWVMILINNSYHLSFIRERVTRARACLTLVGNLIDSNKARRNLHLSGNLTSLATDNRITHISQSIGCNNEQVVLWRNVQPHTFEAHTEQWKNRRLICPPLVVISMSSVGDWVFLYQQDQDLNDMTNLCLFFYRQLRYAISFCPGE